MDKLSILWLLAIVFLIGASYAILYKSDWFFVFMLIFVAVLFIKDYYYQRAMEAYTDELEEMIAITKDDVNDYIYGTVKKEVKRVLDEYYKDVK